MKQQLTKGLDGRQSIPSEHPRRRYVVRYGRGAHETTVELEELAAAVRRHESIGNQGELGDKRLVEIDLHHAHLPKLAAEGAVKYDPAERTVRFENDSHPRGRSSQGRR
jgi:hypothetical protein